MPSDEHSDDFDEIARGLRELRAGAGGPSYAEIGSRIARDRIARGVPVSAATPARTTVYDAFRPGRARISATLVAEIVRALGGDEADAAHWEARCGRAQSARHTPTGSVATAPLAPAPTPRAAAAPAPTPPAPTPPEAGASPARVAALPAARHRALWAAALLVGCVALNVSGHAVVTALALPLFLDMIGTAVAAIAVGPWWGVLVAIASALSVAVAGGAETLPFGLVNVAGALAWGYGVRMFGIARSLPRFLALGLTVGVVCTAISVPLLMTMFGGDAGHASDDIAVGLVAAGEDHAPAVFTANLVTSLADKLITGFVALAVICVLPARVIGPDMVGSLIGRAASGDARRGADARTDAARSA